jgi:DNA adenine methylase
MRKVIDRNGLQGGHYMEPYAGGAGIAVSLLLANVVSHIHINDLNRSIHAFWHAVLHQADELCARIASTDVNMEVWHAQRRIQDDPNANGLDLAFSTFFLNRTNRSGIIRGGVIGGKAQDGAWTLDARFNKEDMISRIERISVRAEAISLYNLDAAVLIDAVLPALPASTLVYLDPPYYVKGRGLYEHHYSHESHVDIATRVATIGQPWIVSYDAVAPIKKLYASYRQKRFGLHYSANGRFRGSEVMILKDGLVVPRSIAPSRAEAA